MSRRICIDWGSSKLRAALFDGAEIVDTRQSDRGIKCLAGPAEIEATFDEIVAGWTESAREVYLSGMVTSRNGWVETAYLPVRADLHDLMRRATVVDRNGLSLNFMPGISQADPADVMRGEEVQLSRVAGSGLKVAILPGTHSKWAVLEGHRVARFQTSITGELREMLGAHSLVGKLAEPGPALGPAFDRGVEKGFQTGTIASVFAARAGVLLGQMRGDEVMAYLGGLLIGIEINAMQRLMPEIVGHPLHVLADGEVAVSYQRACELCGVSIAATMPNSAFDGFASLLSPGAPA